MDPRDMTKHQEEVELTCIGSWKLFLAHGYHARVGTRELWKYILGALRWTLTPLSTGHSSVPRREKILWSLVTQKSLSQYAPSLKTQVPCKLLLKAVRDSVVHHQSLRSCFILQWWKQSLAPENKILIQCHLLSLDPEFMHLLYYSSSSLLPW